MSDKDLDLCMSRRSAVKVTGAGGLSIAFGLPDLVQGATGNAKLEHGIYPELVIGKLSELEEEKPLAFSYPLKQQPNMLIKLGTEARGGIGPQHDIVAFSALCTHMGGSLRGRYRPDVKALGPCPFHFSTFDLRKGGIPVHASATQKLPQVVLRLDGDDIIAIGVNGLIYGYRNNLLDGELPDKAKPGSGKRTIMAA